MATVSPETILRDLAGLWTDTARHAEGEAGEGVLRACAMTLIIIADDESDLSSLEASIADLMPQHPARVILVRLSDGPAQAPEARVYAQCWLPFGGRRQICSERIDIAGHYGSLDNLPVFLMPLLASDLPSVLWIRSGRLLEGPIQRGLTAIADKNVLDSIRMPDPRKALATMAELSAAGVMLGDLAWTRLTRFRAVLWRAFESRKRLDELQRVSTVRVISGGNRADTMAWYLGAWVLDSLEAVGLHPELRIAPDPATAPGVLRLEMRGTDLDTVFELCEQRLRLQLGSSSNCMSLRDPTETDLMREELGIVRHDEIFERALATAARRAAAE